MAFPAVQADDAKKPNIIIFFADNLGYGELGCYGQKKIKTPHIDQLAVEGMKFTQFYSGQNVCAPSRCALLTGKHMGHAAIREAPCAQQNVPHGSLRKRIQVAQTH